MSSMIRSFAALVLAGLALAFTAPVSSIAYAEGGKASPAARQVALTEKQIETLLLVYKDYDTFNVQRVASSATVSQANSAVIAQLNAIARKNGHVDYAEYSVLIANIGLVIAGVDPKTKTYVGPDARFRQKIADVQADRTMSAEDRKDALDDLQAGMKTPLPPIEHKGNIALVIKHFDRLLPLSKDE